MCNERTRVPAFALATGLLMGLLLSQPGRAGDEGRVLTAKRVIAQELAIVDASGKEWIVLSARDGPDISFMGRDADSVQMTLSDRALVFRNRANVSTAVLAGGALELSDPRTERADVDHRLFVVSASHGAASMSLRVAEEGGIAEPRLRLLTERGGKAAMTIGGQVQEDRIDLGLDATHEATLRVQGKDGRVLWKVPER